MRILTNQIVMVDNKIQRLPEDAQVKEIVITDTESKKIIKKIKM